MFAGRLSAPARDKKYCRRPEMPACMQIHVDMQRAALGFFKIRHAKGGHTTEFMPAKPLRCIRRPSLASPSRSEEKTPLNSAVPCSTAARLCLRPLKRSIYSSGCKARALQGTQCPRKIKFRMHSSDCKPQVLQAQGKVCTHTDAGCRTRQVVSRHGERGTGAAAMLTV